MSRRVRLLATTLLLAACATPPAPKTTESLYEADGTRKRPLTPEEAEERIVLRAEQFRFCYQRERINLDTKTGNYVFRVWIPADGSGADVEAIKETVPNLITLRGCLIDVLEKTSFPKHKGEPMTLNVPIEER